MDKVVWIISHVIIPCLNIIIILKYRPLDSLVCRGWPGGWPDGTSDKSLVGHLATLHTPLLLLVLPVKSLY